MSPMTNHKKRVRKQTTKGKGNTNLAVVGSWLAKRTSFHRENGCYGRRAIFITSEQPRPHLFPDLHSQLFTFCFQVLAVTYLTIYITL